MIPPSLQSFSALILQSRLLGPEELERLLRMMPDARTATPTAFADHLVAVGALTRYQADKLLRGVVDGLVFGPFTVLDLLGRGAMGNVYRVVDRRDGALRALKVLPPAKAAAEPWRVLRFHREMVLAARVNHPNVARCREFGRQDGIHYLVFDALPGQTLADVVEAEGPLPLGRAIRLFAGIAAGLTHIHAQGLIHRDLSPSNIQVGPNDHPWILDLGLALLTTERRHQSAAAPDERPVGTAGYLAPEQRRDSQAVDDRADVYSLGCCLRYALIGAVGEGLGGAQPPEVGELLAAMLAEEPAERPTAAAVATALAAAAG
ncbi:MAG: serine/threonine protein kinase [Gemmataceae bacterium]|nr:serine/threonine protein kinase [Gemmataceae bacterium]MDW8266864.1 serine/threonine-protein kinase [Gemmataceae bacterium]